MEVCAHEKAQTVRPGPRAHAGRPEAGAVIQGKGKGEMIEKCPRCRGRGKVKMSILPGGVKIDAECGRCRGGGMEVQTPEPRAVRVAHPGENPATGILTGIWRGEAPGAAPLLNYG